MYNGIGLQTPRGSGTSGYIVRNLSSKPRPKQNKDDFIKTLQRLRQQAKPPLRKANPQIVEFERKKEILIHTMKLRKKLEAEGKSKELIDQTVLKAERVLIKKLESGDLDATAKDSHMLSQAKQRQYQKLRDAFGMSKDYKAGSAFDFQGQQVKKLQQTAIKVQKEESKRYACPHKDCHKNYQYENELARHLKYKHKKAEDKSPEKNEERSKRERDHSRSRSPKRRR